MPTKKKTTKKTSSKTTKKAASRSTKKTTSASKSAAKKSSAPASSKGYWHSVKSGHDDTFDKHPNLKLLLFLFIVCFVIFLIVEIPVLYSESQQASYILGQ